MGHSGPAAAAAARRGHTDRLTKVYDQPPTWLHRGWSRDPFIGTAAVKRGRLPARPALLRQDRRSAYADCLKEPKASLGGDRLDHAVCAPASRNRYHL